MRDRAKLKLSRVLKTDGFLDRFGEYILKASSSARRNFRHEILVANPRHRCRRRIMTRNREIPRTNTRRRCLFPICVTKVFVLSRVRLSKIHIITVRTECERREKSHRVQAPREAPPVRKGREKFESRAPQRDTRLFRWWSISFVSVSCLGCEWRIAVFPPRWSGATRNGSLGDYFVVASDIAHVRPTVCERNVTLPSVTTRRIQGAGRYGQILRNM